jgi:hypothetical protein
VGVVCWWKCSCVLESRSASKQTIDAILIVVAGVRQCGLGVGVEVNGRLEK